MESFRKLAFTAMITFFAGSVVSVAARDMRAGLEQQGSDKQAEVRNLIDQLRGESLLKKGEAYVDDQVMPPRKPGALLTERDRGFFKTLLRRILGAAEDPSKPSQQQSSPSTQ
jgi:hypothetical protein